MKPGVQLYMDVKKQHGLKHTQMAELLGVNISSCWGWMRDANGVAMDIQRTLKRLQGPHPELPPRIHPDIAMAFEEDRYQRRA